MYERRLTALLPLALLAIVCATLGLAWVVEPQFAPTTWPVRLVMVLISAALVVATIHLALMQSQSAARAAERYVGRLCELDSTLVQEENALDLVPFRKEDAPWRELAQKVRRRMAEFARQADAIEMARAGVEVRFRRLAAERDQLREILMNLTDPVLAIDSFGEVVVANTSAERLLDIRTTDEAHPIFQQLQRCEELVSLLSETRKRKTAAQRCGEVSLASADGKQRHFRVTCRTLSAQQLAVAGERGAVAVLTDISNLKAIQKRNAEFVSAVSHEMKTPLSSIRAYIELLVDGEAEDDATREEFLGVINNQADRLQRLIDNLLNLARIEAGVVAVNKSAQSLNERLTEAIRVLEPAAVQKQISLTSEFSELYLGVLGDRDMLLQAAINLISNALKYTHRGGSVTVRSRLNDKEVVFEVQDSGVGLAPDDCQRVFEKFYRVKKDSDMAQGTGLGLALVKHIVEDVHGGRVEVESELGRGSTFRVILPGLGQINA
ncbi:MAG: cell wall metabolism sensor histidine kinase WalK [Planctomycetaceae bacterium]|nr:cell wall metabolism sensor histidine kinase WalK [Planctomycetaceae bacterium]